MGPAAEVKVGHGPPDSRIRQRLLRCAQAGRRGRTNASARRGANGYSPGRIWTSWISALAD